MSHATRRPLAVLALAFLLAGTFGMAGAAMAQGRSTIATTTVTGPITPVIADHLADTVDAAAAEGHAALLVELDTPGGLVTSMREIVQSFFEADVPVIVYVSPRGADAGSAGTFITLSAHIAAMAPATTIGAATPVDLQGGEIGDKVINNAAAYAETIAEERGRNVEFAVESVRDGRSITANEALEIGAIDLIADSIEDLLAEVDGTEVELADGTVTLTTANATLVPIEMSGARRFLQTLADPNLAFIFISIGTLAIIYEVANPGVGAGGIIGAVMLILAFFSLSVLPVNYAGAALVVLGVGLLVAELFVPGVGVMAAGGTVALVLGGLFLFQRPTGVGIDISVLVPTAVLAAGGAAAIGTFAARTRSIAPMSGTDQLVGRTIRIDRIEDGQARARIDGTWWRLLPEGEVELAREDEVTVVGADGLDLIVAPHAHHG